jgi:hypothetical protein
VLNARLGQDKRTRSVNVGAAKGEWMLVSGWSFPLGYICVYFLERGCVLRTASSATTR